jgi:hypothetical protein
MLQFLSDDPQIHRRNSRISLARAVDAVLADKHQSIRHAVQRDGQSAALPPVHLLKMFQLFLVLIKCIHGWQSLVVHRLSPLRQTVAHRAHTIRTKLYPMRCAEHNSLEPPRDD